MLGGCAKSTPTAGPTQTAEVGSVSVQRYADTLCTSLAVVQSVATDRPSASGAGLVGVKDQAVVRLRGLLGAVDGLLFKLHDVGIPDVDGGATASSAIHDAFTQVRDTFQRALDETGSLRTGNRAAFNRSMAAIASTTQSALDAAGESLRHLDAPALDEAVASSRACTDVFVAIPPSTPATS